MSIAKSAVVFEYKGPGSQHAIVINLLRRAIKQGDLRALIKLQEMITDIKGS